MLMSMARNNVTVTADTTRLNRLLKQLPGAIDDNIRAIAFTIEGRAKMNSPIDTGALRASIYTQTLNGQYQDNRKVSFAQIESKATALNRDAELEQLPETKKLEVIVGPSVNYAIDVELGTSRRAATPFLTPAVRSVENDMARHMGQAIQDALK